jgi:hypothetical protein
MITAKLETYHDATLCAGWSDRQPDRGQGKTDFRSLKQWTIKPRAPSAAHAKLELHRYERGHAPGIPVRRQANMDQSRNWLPQARSIEVMTELSGGGLLMVTSTSTSLSTPAVTVAC